MPAAPVQHPAALQTPTRDEIFRMSQRATPWVMLPIVDRAIEADPDDLQMALLGVRTLARLGLRTPAIERIEALGGRISGIDGAQALLAGIESMAPESEARSRRLRMAERNVRALAERGIDLRAPFEDWKINESAWEHLRAIGGNIVRRRHDEPMSLGWRWVGDLRDGMARFAAQSLQQIEHFDYPRLAIEGMNPPWLLQEFFAITAGGPHGYEPEIAVLQSDLSENFEGLSLADLREIIGSDRVRFYLGEDATERYLSDSMANAGVRLSGLGMTSLTTRTRLEPTLTSVIQQISTEQQALADRLCAQAQAPYEGRDSAWWADRFAEAMQPGSKKPLRVLIPSCRYTTWIQHASASLASALRRLGCKVELLIEPDLHSHLHECAFHQVFNALEPDLVVLLNYTRAGRGRAIPASVPLVCWVQDALSPLFSKDNGAAQGDLDFVVGHVYQSMLEQFGFRADRAMRFPVAADEEVFQPTGFSIGGSTEFESEIAYVSHHSESPEVMLQRLIREDGEGRNEAMLRSIAASVRSLLEGSNTNAFRQPLRSAVASAVTAHRPGPDHDGIASRVFHQFAIPLAEREIRHETLRWALAASRRRGWRLAVYGNGWDRNDEFAECARGPLPHGAALRDCYERSVVQLHASVCNPAHQRVQECALSGGFPLSRITRDALQVEFELMRLGAMGAIEPAMYDKQAGLVGFACDDHEEVQAIAYQLDTLGMSMEQGPDGALLWIDASEWERRSGATAIPMVDTRTRWLFGDLASCAVTDAEGLERIVARAIEDPAWRRGVGAGIAGRVRERLTAGAIASEMLGIVRDGLAGHTSGMER